MAIAKEGYVIIAIATAVALVGFLVAAILGSWAVWLGAYLFVILTLAVTFLAFREPGPSSGAGQAEPGGRAHTGEVAASDFREASQ